jgi:AcrR family transcriptional regulator
MSAKDVKGSSAEVGKPRTGGSKARATRAMLIELAAELFSEQGYGQTSIRDIARRAALTTGAVYGQFQNKADLLVEAINSRIADELEAQSPLQGESSHVQTLARLAYQYPMRRRLRALIVQGAAASLTDKETRDRLRDEQLVHLNEWIVGYERERHRLGIDDSVDIQSAVLYTWAAEVGLGVLEAVGIQPRSRRGWSDVSGRFARSLMLPKSSGFATSQKTKGDRRSSRDTKVIP